MKKSGFLEGTFIATLGVVITKILGMLYVIPFYAIVGAMGSALYSYAYNIYMIFLDISSAGLPVAISKIIKEYNTLGKMDAKVRAYKIGRKIVSVFSLVSFFLLFVFAKELAILMVGDLASGGNSVNDVTMVIRAISFSVLIIPLLSVAKGYLQGHNIFTVSSVSQVLEQFVRVLIIVLGSYVSLNILKLSLPFSVSVALTGAFFGGVVAISYVYLNISRNKKELSLEGEISKDNITDKEIFKKIISYAIPFIIVDISSSLYNFIDMVLISKTMSYLKYDALRTEFITASVATWSAKINMIVNSIAMGLTVSLIPNIVEAFTLKDWKLVESRFNKALEVILISSIPMVIGISLLSEPIWNIFYGSENLVLGAKVLSVYIFISLFTNIFMVTSTTLQGLNKFKSVYLVTILGYIINAILDVPLMLLCNYLHLEPFIGALLSSMIGYTSASLVTILILRKDYKISYRKTINTLLHLILPVTSMIIVVILLKTIIPLDYSNRIYSILYVLLISLIGAITYLYLTYKDGVLLNVFGHRYIEKIMKKLTFKK